MTRDGDFYVFEFFPKEFAFVCFHVDIIYQVLFMYLFILMETDGSQSDFTIFAGHLVLSASAQT